MTGDEATDLPDAIEEITPAPDAVQVLQQTQVVVDLAEGYEGRLIIDDVALATIRLDEVGSVDVEPGEQVDVPPGVVFEPGNGTLTFTPGDPATDRALRPRRAHRHGHLLEDRSRARRRPLLHLDVQRDLTSPAEYVLPPSVRRRASTHSRASTEVEVAGLEEVGEGGLVEDRDAGRSALVTLLAPGLSPTTRANVLALTLPGLLPPRAMIAASASSRV